MADEYSQAEVLLIRCLRLFREIGNGSGVAACLQGLAVVATARASELPVSTPGASSRAGQGLTARERQVAILVSQGLTNREIAQALAIAEGTARRHVTNILGKLEFRSRTQLAVWATATSPGLCPRDDD